MPWNSNKQSGVDGKKCPNSGPAAANNQSGPGSKGKGQYKAPSRANPTSNRQTGASKSKKY